MVLAAEELLGPLHVAFPFPCAPRLYDLLETGRRIAIGPGAFEVDEVYRLLDSTASDRHSGHVHAVRTGSRIVGWLWSEDLRDLRVPPDADTVDERGETGELPQRLVSRAAPRHRPLGEPATLTTPVLGWARLGGAVATVPPPTEQGAGPVTVVDAAIRQLGPIRVEEETGRSLPRTAVLYRVESALVGCWTLDVLLDAACAGEPPDAVRRRYWQRRR